jgi:hypothetical protein
VAFLFGMQALRIAIGAAPPLDGTLGVGMWESIEVLTAAVPLVVRSACSGSCAEGRS